MGKKSGSTTEHFNNKVRIKNKTRALLKRIKNIKPETQEIIKKNCRIGRKKEGYDKEKFKFLPRKKPVAVIQEIKKK